MWVSDPPAPTGVLDTRPPVPAPVRPLLPNEKLEAGPMGIGVMVVRTDLQSGPKDSGGFTDSDRATLNKIAKAKLRDLLDAEAPARK